MAEGKSKTGVVKKRASKREKKDWIAAYIFIAPVTFGLLVFYIENIRKYIEVRCGYGSGWIVLINTDRSSSELQD